MMEDAERLAERVVALTRENVILTLKSKGTLANNLCPDCRDKQVGQPCLACTIQTLKQQRDAGLAREAKLHTMKDIAYRIVCDYARDNPIHEWMGVQQDPMGAHAWLEEFNNLLALPTDDSALMERLKEEREKVIQAAVSLGAFTPKSPVANQLRSMT